MALYPIEFRRVYTQWCRCCGVVKANRARGLCWHCYYTPGSAERFPSTSKYANKEHGEGNHRRRLPAAPCDAMPGSEERIRTLEARVEAGVHLWHPRDRRLEK